MDAVWGPVGLGLVALVLTALVVAWWEHRRRLGEMQRRLELSEESRFMLEQQTGEIGARLVALSEALVATRRRSALGDAPAPGDQAERASTMSTAMIRMSVRPTAPAAPAPRGDAFWQDTQPMIVKPPAPAYAPTMPAPLDPPPRR